MEEWRRGQKPARAISLMRCEPPVRAGRRLSVGARRRGKRRDMWVWTAVIEEGNGRRWVDFEVGGRTEGTFLKFYIGCLRQSNTRLMATIDCQHIKCASLSLD